MTMTAARPTIGDDIHRILLGTALVDATQQLYEHAQACRHCTRRRRCAEHVIGDHARATYWRALSRLKAPATVLEPDTAATIAAALAAAAAGRRGSQHPADRALADAYEILVSWLATGLASPAEEVR